MKTQTTSIAKTLIKMAAVLSVLLLASAVSAQECGANADCGDGFVCSFDDGGGSTVCSSSTDGEDDCEEPDQGLVEPSGECVPAPVQCFADSECDGGLSCLFGGGDTSDPTDVNVPAPDEDDGDKLNNAAEPEAGVCGWGFEQCSADADCGEFGECVSVGSSNCATPAPGPCTEDECDSEEPIDCEPEEIFACVPREIECETDSACPSDWRCQDIVIGGCGGSGSDGGSTGSVSPGNDDGDDDGDKNPNSDNNCAEEVRTLCVPPFTGSADDFTAGGGDNNGPFPSSNEGDPNTPRRDGFVGEGSDEDGGCTVVGLGQKTGGGAMLTLLLGMMMLGVRQRRR